MAADILATGDRRTALGLLRAVTSWGYDRPRQRTRQLEFTFAGGRDRCRAADCQAPARKGGLCWAHLKRRQRGAAAGQPVLARIGSWDSVVDAMHEYVDAEGDNEFAAARNRVQRTMRAWALGRIADRCPPTVGG